MNAPVAAARFAVPRSGFERVRLTPGALRRLGPAWDRLVADAENPNPFYSRAVVEAHLANGVGAGPEALAVAEGGGLLALLPLHPRRRRIGLWRPCLAGWTSPYTCEGTPLVAAHRLEEAASALLDGMGGVAPRLWLLPRVALQGPTVQAIRAELTRRGWPHAVLSEAQRAVLDRRSDHAAYLALLSRNRRKGLRRQAARLAQLGRVEHSAAQGGPALQAAVEAFLALEAAGWKGRRGTALAARPGTRGLAHDLAAAQGPVTPRADLLTLDGRPVAASLGLVSGDTLYLLKSAYDEALRGCGPGILLETAIVQAMHGEGFVRRLDSCAGPGTPLDGLYPDRVALGDLLLYAAPQDPRRFAAAVAAEIRVRACRLLLKDRMGQMRRWADRMRARFAAPAEG